MASSSERTEALELMQAQNDEGPCFECFHAWSGQCSSEDLWRRSGAGRCSLRPRWQQGFCSVQAVPMRVRGETVGALNLFRSRPDGCEPDVPLGQGMADIAAIALLQERAVRESRGVVAQLQGALRSRVVIEQAKGVVAERARIGVDVAFARFRAHARITTSA